MNAAKRRGFLYSFRAMFSKILPASGGGKGLTLILIVAGLLGASVWAWNKWGSEITADASYTLLPDNIKMNPPLLPGSKPMSKRK